MRPIILLTLPAIIFGAVSALIIPSVDGMSKRDPSRTERSIAHTDITTRDQRDVDIGVQQVNPSRFDDLVSREIFNADVVLEGRLAKLDRKPSRKDRKRVKKYHKNVVKQEMKKLGGDSAQIKCVIRYFSAKRISVNGKYLDTWRMMLEPLIQNAYNG
ncbi:hypothetical protein BDQ17DRAFT_1369519 [Cyathus striatus]|nr:hypothetical protein BDQ17DRAFT_1369519 [Cyathus striatus]